MNQVIELEHLKTLSIKKGDVLVIRSDDPSPEISSVLRERLRTHFGFDVPVIWVSPDTDIAVLRPDGA
jgi:hypothetical protein